MDRKQKSYWIAVIIILLTGAYTGYLNHLAESLKARSPFGDLPKGFGNWVGMELEFDDFVYAQVRADTTVFRRYINQGNESVYFYLGYYSQQRGSFLEHTPGTCYPALGWTVLEKGTEPIAIRGNESSGIKVNKLLLRKGDQAQLVLYWYQSGSKVNSDELRQRFDLIMKRILGKRSDRALIRVSAPVVEGSLEKTLTLERKFIQQVFPHICKFLPN